MARVVLPDYEIIHSNVATSCLWLLNAPEAHVLRPGVVACLSTHLLSKNSMLDYSHSFFMAVLPVVYCKYCSDDMYIIPGPLPRLSAIPGGLLDMLCLIVAPRYFLCLCSWWVFMSLP